MSFTRLFYKHIMFRHSCGKCYYTNLQRPSDITLADYWGWERTDPDFNADNKGVSLILVNTEKGKELFEAIKERIEFREAKLENCMQPNLKHPTKISKDRAQFERDYMQFGFDYTYNKYCKKTVKEHLGELWHKLRSKLARMIRFIVR